MSVSPPASVTDVPFVQKLELVANALRNSNLSGPEFCQLNFFDQTNAATTMATPRTAVLVHYTKSSVIDGWYMTQGTPRFADRIVVNNKVVGFIKDLRIVPQSSVYAVTIHWIGTDEAVFLYANPDVDTDKGLTVALTDFSLDIAPQCKNAQLADVVASFMGQRDQKAVNSKFLMWLQAGAKASSQASDEASLLANHAQWSMYLVQAFNDMHTRYGNQCEGEMVNGTCKPRGMRMDRVTYQAGDMPIYSEYKKRVQDFEHDLNQLFMPYTPSDMAPPAGRTEPSASVVIHTSTPAPTSVVDPKEALRLKAQEDAAAAKAEASKAAAAKATREAAVAVKAEEQAAEVVATKTAAADQANTAFVKAEQVVMNNPGASDAEIAADEAKAAAEKAQREAAEAKEQERLARQKADADLAEKKRAEDKAQADAEAAKILQAEKERQLALANVVETTPKISAFDVDDASFDVQEIPPPEQRQFFMSDNILSFKDSNGAVRSVEGFVAPILARMSAAPLNTLESQAAFDQDQATLIDFEGKMVRYKVKWLQAALTNRKQVIKALDTALENPNNPDYDQYESIHQILRTELNEFAPTFNALNQATKALKNNPLFTAQDGTNLIEANEQSILVQLSGRSVATTPGMQSQEDVEALTAFFQIDETNYQKLYNNEHRLRSALQNSRYRCQSGYMLQLHRAIFQAYLQQLGLKSKTADLNVDQLGAVMWLLFYTQMPMFVVRLLTIMSDEVARNPRDVQYRAQAILTAFHNELTRHLDTFVPLDPSDVPSAGSASGGITYVIRQYLNNVRVDVRESVMRSLTAPNC